jgi:single-strand DNA-binding protein
MPSLNRVQLIGYLGRDAEARFTANGKKYATFTLAVNRSWKSTTGEKQEHTDWFMVNAWGKLGDFATEYVKKGRLVLVEGRLQTDRWEDAKGETHYRTTVIARSIQLLDRKPEEPEEVVEAVEAVEEAPE